MISMPTAGWICLFCDKYDPENYASECEDMHEGISPSCDKTEKKVELLEKAVNQLCELHKTLFEDILKKFRESTQ